MSILKKKSFKVHKAMPTELQEVHKRLDAEMQGLTQEWALESLDIERLLPLIHIADNEKLGITKSLLYAYRYGFTDGKKATLKNIEKYLQGRKNRIE